MQLGDSVYTVRSRNAEICHMHLVVLYNGHLGDPLAVLRSRKKRFAVAAVYFADDGELFANDSSVLEQLGKIKRENKIKFANHVEKTTGTKLNIDSIFDVQVKRLHEYKRQQLNALNILADYNYLIQNPDAPFVPKTYIFASKAAPGYYIAKQIIKMIWCIGEEIKHNPKLNEKLSVVFLEDYCVTLSEILMPAAEI